MAHLSSGPDKAKGLIHKLRFSIIALGAAILLLPFRGVTAAIILFAAISITGSSFIFLRHHAGSLWQKLQPVSIKLTTGIMSAVHKRISGYLLLLFLIALPFVVRGYLLDIAILTGIYIILALGLNVMVGFTGLLNLGYAAFYAIGAYSYALLNLKLGLGFWQALPFCIALTTLSGFILSVPALRLKGDYLAIVTLGFGEIVRLVLNNWDSFTGGPNGISGLAPPYVPVVSVKGSGLFYYITLLSVLFSYIIIRNVRLSRIGRAWIAIREDETGASAMGINTTRYKFYAVAFSASWAGLAGALFASKMQFVSPESFTFMESVLILSMVILGGLGNMVGVVVGALVLVTLPEVMREVQSYRMLAVGLGLIIIMIFRPNGLLSGLKAGNR